MFSSFGVMSQKPKWGVPPLLTYTIQPPPPVNVSNSKFHLNCFLCVVLSFHAKILHFHKAVQVQEAEMCFYRGWGAVGGPS